MSKIYPNISLIFLFFIESVKPGYCPVKTDRRGLLGACAPQCQYDYDCEGSQKCCHQGCGLKCVDALCKFHISSKFCIFDLVNCSSLCFGSTGIDHVISEPCYKGTML